VSAPGTWHNQRVTSGRLALLAVVSVLLVAGLSVPAHAATVYPQGYTYPACTKWGTSGADTIYGTSGNEIICGQGGNDIIHGRGGKDKIYGGSGDDTIYGSNSTSTVSTDTMDEIRGDAGNDKIYAYAGKDKVFGNAGNDYIDAGTGNDSIYGDFQLESQGLNGADTIYAGAGNDDTNAGGGNDYVKSGGNTTLDSVKAGSGNDIVIGTGGYHDAFSGDAGNDFLFPTLLRKYPLGNNMSGGAGNDYTILLNGAIDTFREGTTSQTLNLVTNYHCSVSVPLVTIGDVKEWQVGCPSPIKFVDIQVSGTGAVTLGNDFYSQSASWNPTTWRSWWTQQTSTMNGDLCMCDPPYKGIATMDQVS
jgi:Ca2+-binding RTX toxin-like protein